MISGANVDLAVAGAAMGAVGVCSFALAVARSRQTSHAGRRFRESDRGSGANPHTYPRPGLPGELPWRARPVRPHRYELEEVVPFSRPSRSVPNVPLDRTARRARRGAANLAHLGPGRLERAKAMAMRSASTKTAPNPRRTTSLLAPEPVGPVCRPPPPPSRSRLCTSVPCRPARNAATCSQVTSSLFITPLSASWRGLVSGRLNNGKACERLLIDHPVGDVPISRISQDHELQGAVLDGLQEMR
jgi:hypothetical protein